MDGFRQFMRNHPRPTILIWSSAVGVVLFLVGGGPAGGPVNLVLAVGLAVAFASGMMSALRRLRPHGVETDIAHLSG